MVGSDSEAAPSLLPLVADALLLAMVGALWAFHAANAVAVAAGWDGGSVGSRVAAVAGEATRLCFLAVGVLVLLAGPLMFWKIDRSFAKAREVGSGVNLRSERKGERRRPASSGARPRQDGGHRGASLVDLILFICVLVVVLEFEIQVFAPATVASWFATFGSRINVIARFVGCVTMCFGFLPRWFLQMRAL